MTWKIAICQEIFGAVSFEVCCQKAAAFGYDGVELAPYILSRDIRDLSPVTIDEVRATAARHGLELPAMHWLLASPPGMSITSPDPITHEETTAFTRRLVDIAARVGVHVLVFGSPKQRDIDPSWHHGEAILRGIAFLREMAHLCEARGIVIGFEPLGPLTTNFGVTVDDVIGIIDIVGSPALKLHLDVKAILMESTSPVDVIARTKGRVVHFHANDANRLGPGMGAVDYLPIFQALRSAKYSGWISVETFRNDVSEDEIARKSIQYLRRVMAEVER